MAGRSKERRVDFSAPVIEGFGPEGGKQSQVDYEASVGLGWRFGD
jgi:hypothetical protein